MINMDISSTVSEIINSSHKLVRTGQPISKIPLSSVVDFPGIEPAATMSGQGVQVWEPNP